MHMSSERRVFKFYQNFGRGYGQTLSRAQQERHSGPAPGIHSQPKGGKGFDLRIGGNSWLVAIADKLPAYHVRRIDGRNRAKDLDLLVAQGLRVHIRWRLHRQEGYNLKQMILDDVADGARLFIKLAPSLNAKCLRHRDLYAFDVIAVPDRL